MKSAYEILKQRTEEKQAAGSEANRDETAAPSESRAMIGDLLWGIKRRQGMVETLAKQAARTVGSQIGRQILRAALGGMADHAAVRETALR